MSINRRENKRCLVVRVVRFGGFVVVDPSVRRLKCSVAGWLAAWQVNN